MRTWMWVLQTSGFLRKSTVETTTVRAVLPSCQWSGLLWKVWQIICTQHTVMWWVALVCLGAACIFAEAEESSVHGGWENSLVVGKGSLSGSLCWRDSATSALGVLRAWDKKYMNDSCQEEEVNSFLLFLLSFGPSSFFSCYPHPLLHIFPYPPHFLLYGQSLTLSFFLIFCIKICRWPNLNCT